MIIFFILICFLLFDLSVVVNTEQTLPVYKTSDRSKDAKNKYKVSIIISKLVMF